MCMKSLLDGDTEWRYNPKWSLADDAESPLWRDSRLSAKSKGIWAYMRTKPFGWDFCAARMADEMTDGRKGILSGMKELEELGYLAKTKLQNGRVHYTLSDNPWIGIEPTIQKSSLAKYAVILDFPKEDIGHSTRDAVGALMLAYGAYSVTNADALSAIGEMTFGSYAEILEWMDSSRCEIEDALGLPMAVEAF